VPEPRPIKVLMVVDRLDDTAGGGERAAAGLACALPRERFEVWMCTTRLAGGTPIDDLQAAGVRHVHLARTGPVGVRGLVALSRLIRSQRFDVIHGHMFGSNLWVALLGFLCRVPVVVAHEQTWSYIGQPVRKALDFAIGRLVGAFIAVSSADAERMERLERVPRRKILMIPNAWIARAPSATDVRAELNLSADTPVAVTVAIMRPQKRLDVLIDAFALVLERLPQARLLLAGTGPERKATEERARTLGLADRVVFLGVRQDIDAVFRAADLMVMSSDFEGTPLAVAEAFAAGIPVVATDVGGMKDLMTDGREGRLVAPRRPGELADAVVGVLTNPEQRAAMSAAARERATELTSERHAQRIGDLYRRLLDGGPVAES